MELNGLSSRGSIADKYDGKLIDNNQYKVPLKVKRLNEDAELPTYGTSGAACFDFYAVEDINLAAKKTTMVKLGLAVEVPKGYALMLYCRSSIAAKTPLRVANSTGVIDSDYRGEVAVILDNTSTADYFIGAGVRIVQGMLIPIPKVNIQEVSELSETKRGTGGFGSTGK